MFETIRINTTTKNKQNIYKIYTYTITTLTDLSKNLQLRYRPSPHSPPGYQLALSKVRERVIYVTHHLKLLKEQTSSSSTDYIINKKNTLREHNIQMTILVLNTFSTAKLDIYSARH